MSRSRTLDNTAWRWAVAILWMGIIFASSTTVINRPTFVAAVGRALPGAGSFDAWSRFWLSSGVVVVKGYHFTEFALLFVLVHRACARLGGPRARFASLVICLAFAISDEWHQTFVPGRGGTWTDVVIDITGALFAAGLSTWQRRASLSKVE